MAGRVGVPRVWVEQVRAALAAAGLGGLSYGHLAVALSASDMPDQRQGEVPAEWVAKWARQGVDRLGGRGCVRELCERDRVTNRAFVNGTLTRAEHAVLVRQIWGSPQRARRCHGLAWLVVRSADAVMSR